MTSRLTATLKSIRIHGDPKAPVYRNSEGHPYRDISTAFNSAVKRAGMTDSHTMTCGIRLPLASVCGA